MIQVTGQNYMTSKNSNNIIELKELSILVSLYGLSFMFKNIEQNTFKHFEYQFDKRNPFSLESELKKIINERPILKNRFSKVNIIHHNKLNTLVPQELFNNNLLKDYLKFNVQLIANDFVDFDNVAHFQTNNVYVPYVNINNVFLDYNPSINYYHSATIFLEKVYNILTSNYELSLYEVFINVYPNDFQLAIFINEKLYIYNHFDYQDIDEFLYFLFFAIESLDIDKKKTNYTILGVLESSEIVKNLKDFSPNISVYPTNFSSKINNFIL